MKLNKKSLITVLGLSASLTGCYMDSERSDAMMTQQPMVQEQAQTMPATTTPKATASSNPVQKTTPGPKHTVAPKIPVIQ